MHSSTRRVGCADTIVHMRPNVFVVATSLTALLATVAACDAVTPPPSREWHGAITWSPTTRTPTVIGGSAGPYTVTCSGEEKSLNATVNAPDGWQAIFTGAKGTWTVRESPDAKPVEVSGSAEAGALSFLKYTNYDIDSAAYGMTPKDWEFYNFGKQPKVHVDAYIDCSPPS